MKNIGLMMLAIMLSTSAFAKDIELLSIRSEKTGEKTSHLGIRTNDRNEITDVLYRASGDKNPDAYSVKDAQDDWVTMVTAKIVFKVVKFRLVDVKPNSLTVNFRYLFNSKGWVYHDKSISIALNRSTGDYEVRDGSKRVVTQILATNHYVDGDVKGIDEIKAW